MAGQDDDGEKTVFGGPLPDPADLRDKLGSLAPSQDSGDTDETRPPGHAGQDRVQDPFADETAGSGLGTPDQEAAAPAVPHPAVPPPVSGDSDRTQFPAPPAQDLKDDMARPVLGAPLGSTQPPFPLPDDTRPPQDMPPMQEAELTAPPPSTLPGTVSDAGIDDTRPPTEMVPVSPPEDDDDLTAPPLSLSETAGPKDVVEPRAASGAPEVPAADLAATVSDDDDIERTILGAALPFDEDPVLMEETVDPDEDIERTILGAALSFEEEPDAGPVNVPAPSEPETERTVIGAALPPVVPPVAPRPIPEPAPPEDTERTIIGSTLPLSEPTEAPQVAPIEEEDTERTVFGAPLPVPDPPAAAPVAAEDDTERTIIGQGLPPAAPPLTAPNEESTIIGAALPTHDDSTILGAALPQVQQPPNAPAQPERRTLEQMLKGPVLAPSSSANPLMAAGSRLLNTLGQLRNGATELDLDTLADQLARELETFEQTAVSAKADPTEAQIAKYVLCGTADDIIQSLPGTDAGSWRQGSLVSRFFRDAGDSGIGVFQEAEKAMQTPRQRFNLLELFLCCLNLGFEGQYRHMENGKAQLARIRTAIHEALRRVQPRRGADLSATWLPVVPGGKKRGRGMPLWGVFSTAAAILVAFYASLSYLIHDQGTKVAWAYRLAHPDNFLVQLERPVPGPVFVAKTPDQITRLTERLIAEIDAGLVRIEEKGDFIILKAGENLRFESGSASVNSGLVPVSGVLARALDPEPGLVYVIGHSDAQGSFTRNQLLSQARADAVADVLRATFADPGRLTVLGRGESEPIAQNGTEEGRALNRRVEILVAREGSE